MTSDFAIAAAEAGEATTVEVKTLVLVDLVDSTKLVETLGDEQAVQMLARHDRLARDLVARFGGREIDKTDGFLLLFEHPAHAVQCILDYHRALAELSRELGVEIKARAGIHVGEVFLRQNPPEDVARGAKPIEVEGLAKPLGARVMALAGGGQTLLTVFAFELARATLAGGRLCWLEHGRYSFKGIRRPVAVFEVGEEGLAPLKAPARPARVTPWLLPLLVTLLVVLVAGGLSLTRLKRARDVRPAVTILGFKNIGPTQGDWLSVAIAELLSTDLAAGGQLRLIPGESVARMKRELALPETDTLAPDTLERIRSNLGTDYVVLGSFLRLGQEANQRLTLNLRLQRTIDGESIVQIGEQGVEAELFDLVSRSGAALRRGLGLVEIAAEQAAEVRAVLPSSPEATRLYSEGLAKLRQYDASGAKELLSRAVQVDPDYGLAYAALSDADSALGYDARAAESAERAFELARDLPREASLAIEGRFYETADDWPQAVRTYELLWEYHFDDVDHGLKLAAAQTAADQGQEALQTIADLHALPPPAGEDPRIDLAEARAADVLSDRGRMLEAAERAVRKGEAKGTPTLAAEGRLLQGAALNLLGKPARAAEVLRAAHDGFAQVGDQGGMARSLNKIAVLRNWQGEYAEAERFYRQVLEIHRRRGDRKHEAQVLNDLAVLTRNKGDLATARDLLAASRDLGREIANKTRESWALENIVTVLYAEGRLAEAETAAQEALGLAREIAKPSLTAWLDYDLGRIALARGDLELAGERFQAARRLCNELGYKHLAAFALHGLGELRLAQGDLEAAAASLADSRRIRTELDQRGNLAATKLTRARLMIESRRPAEAETLARQAIQGLEQAGLLDQAVAAEIVFVEALLAGGRPDEARRRLDRVAGAAAASQDPRTRLAATLAKARLRAGEGDYPRGRQLLAAARAEAEGHSLAGLELEARFRQGELERAAGDPATARRQLADLAQEASARGFGRLAAKAAELTGAQRPAA